MQIGRYGWAVLMIFFASHFPACHAQNFARLYMGFCILLLEQFGDHPIEATLLEKDFALQNF